MLSLERKPINPHNGGVYLRLHVVNKLWPGFEREAGVQVAIFTA